MPEMSRDYLEKKRDEYQMSIFQLQGAIEAITAMLADCYVPAMTMQQLGDTLGAVEIGEPEPVKGGNNGA